MYVTEDTTRADPETLRRLYIDRDPRRRLARLHRRHRGPRDARPARRRWCASSPAWSRSAASGVGHRLARPPRPRSRDQQHAGGARRRGDAGARRGDRDRRARRQHADGPAARQPRADGLHRARPVGRSSSTAASSREATGVPMPANYPVVGRDAFRTATGVHAAAVIKAFRKNDTALVDAVYSGVPASMVGRGQEIEIGPMSGKSNVVFWLERRGFAGHRRDRRAHLREGQEFAVGAHRGRDPRGGKGGSRAALTLTPGDCVGAAREPPFTGVFRYPPAPPATRPRPLAATGPTRSRACRASCATPARPRAS